MKKIFVILLFGVINYFLVFEIFGLDRGIGWIVFLILGIPMFLITKKLSKKKEKEINSEYFHNENIYDKSSVTKETLLNELLLAENEFNNMYFYVVKEIVEYEIKQKHYEIIEIINKSGRSSREWIYSIIGNVAGDLLESGKYHVYLGLLDTVGQNLLEIFDKSYDLILHIKAKNIDIEYVNEQKATLRRNIKRLG